MTLSEKARREIEQIISGVMEKVIARVKFDPEEFKESRPFHSALVPDEVWKGSKFERSFVTSLGQVVFEKIAVIIAQDAHDFAQQNYPLKGTITQGELDHINTILRELEHKGAKRRTPNWKRELREVEQAISGPKVSVKVISDLYVRSSKKEMFFEIKSSKPNADQSLQTKRKLLQIQAIKRGENIETFFALPDNPYGSKAAYDWPHPKRYFDMNRSPCVIMGADFWNHLGGRGTWKELIALFREVGNQYKKQIRDEY